MADETRDPLNDQALAAAFRAARHASGNHLTETEWERLACDEMTPPERDSALAHIMGCAECTTIHRSLIELGAGVDQFPSSGTSYRRWTIAGGLATAAAVLAALLINRPTRVDPNVVTRSGTEVAAIVVLSPRANEPVVDRRFSWQGIAGATSYELRVSTQDGVRIFTSRRDETSAALPGEIELKEGTYYWRVVAFKGDAELAASPLIPFILRGR